MTVTPPQHLAAVALVALDAVARGARIRLMVPMPLSRAIAVNAGSEAVAAVTPARLGGDVARFFALRRWGAGTSALLAAFTTEVLADAVVLLAIGLPCLLLFAGATRAWMERLVGFATSPSTRWIALGVLAVTVAAGVAALRFRRRLHVPVHGALREAWHILWRRPRPVVAALMGLTLVSVAARAAILPVLAAGVVGVRWGPMVLGSVALLAGQAVLPTPSGVGALDAGFAAGFAGGVTGGDLAQLLLTWRLYSLVLAAVAGAVLARAGWAGSRRRRHGTRARFDDLPPAYRRRECIAASLFGRRVRGGGGLGPEGMPVAS